MAKAAIALGSNIPPRKNHLIRALEAIDSIPGIRILDRSRIYETEPVGGPPQGLYLNAAVTVETVHAPPDLLRRLLGIEKEMGRIRTEKNEPRIIDLDIIFYDDLTQNDPFLELPHSRFRERGFVLLPLNDILPGFTDPETGRTVAELLDAWRSAGGKDHDSPGQL
jgi:2-amino-4-hydroxy-6-hydroxymethyldihydropteridine diphosphokinase